MTRYKQGNGRPTFISDAAVVGFVSVMENVTEIITTGGKVGVVGEAEALHDAWATRMDKVSEAAALNRARGQ